MSEDWTEYRVKHIGEVIGGATPSTKNESNFGGNIPWITPKDLSDYKYRHIYVGDRSITKTGYESCSTRLMPKDTVLVSSRAPIGYIAIAGRELCTNQGFKSIVPDKDIVDPLFLYYAILNNIESIKNLGSGTTFPEISTKILENYRIRLPGLEVQKKISQILSSIDDKIECNYKINDYLSTFNSYQRRYPVHLT